MDKVSNQILKQEASKQNTRIAKSKICPKIIHSQSIQNFTNNLFL